MTLTLMAVTLCLSRSPDAQPEALGSTLLGAGFLYCILSASSLDPNSSGPQGPFGLMWLSLPHLVYNSISSSTATPTVLTELYNSSTPTWSPLDLWNRMFNRHQAEITVMQFRGHSLPVRQSMRVSWDFFTSSHFISQFPPTRFPLITAIRMCQFLPVYHLEWHFGPGWRSKYYICSFLKLDFIDFEIKYYFILYTLYCCLILCVDFDIVWEMLSNFLI